MRFIDECSLPVRAGRGGNGCASFLREKFIPFGGPNGGDGGRGGDVIVEADPGKNTLLELTNLTRIKADDGTPGQGKDCYGRTGKSYTLRLPLGTMIRDAETGSLLCELTQIGESHVVARGGRGGRGNRHFVTPTDRAPRRFEPGEAGESRTLLFELRVMADVGLLGFPNVGKSTLISAVSRARPKIADYPFTTLTPQLGMVSVGGARPGAERSFVIADIPGLIRGASEGAGLGTQFLRHLERTRVLLHLVTLDPTPGREPLEDYFAIREELQKYSPDLAKRPEIVALSKADLTDVRDEYPRLTEAFAEKGIRLELISAASREGLDALLHKLADELERIPKE
jgi:GTPase